MDYSEIVVILDRSGSMQTAKSDHEGGLNSFIEDQKQLAGDVRFTLIQFDSDNPCEVVYDGCSLDAVDQYQLIPRGGTPLMDAIGRAVAHVSGRLDNADRKPDQVVVMVITDGQENASFEYTKQRIKDLVAEREKSHGWKFLFLGANIDAFAEGGSYGFAAASTGGYVNRGPQVQAMYAAVSQNTKMARCAIHADAAPDDVYANYNFTSAQLSAMSETGDQSQGDTTWKSTSSQSS